MHIQRRSDEVIRDTLRVVRAQILGMWRYRWIGMAIAWFACIGGWAGVYLMPDVYSANARVYVDTENAIDDFLGQIATPTDVMSEVNLVVREIVSRPNLAEVARNTDLALRAETSQQFEDLLTSLQDKITVDGNREGVFSIAFRDQDRDKALAVVDTLLTAFVEKSLGADRTDTAKAQRFLEQQIVEYELRLTDAEDKLATFKRENVHLMPGQQGDYFSRLQAAEDTLVETQTSLNLAIERRDEIMRQIEGEEPVFGIVSPSVSGDGEVGAASMKIRELELQLAELRLQYTDKHPRIGQILSTIDLLREQQAVEAQIQAGVSGGNSLQGNPLDQNPVYQNMRIQLTNVEVDIAALRAQRSQQQQDVTRLRQLVDTIPQIEAELNRLNRDYDVVKAKHQQLLQQLETANIGEDVSRSIDEVQFRIIDPPFSDLTPTGPNRPILLAGVLILGLGAAVVVVFMINQLNPTFIGSRLVTDVLGIPVLASVSLLQTPAAAKSERIGRYALHAAGVVLLVTFVLTVKFAEPGSLLVRDLMGSVS